MNQQTIPLGWHCDALPTGAFVVLVPNQHVLTHLGPIAFSNAARQPLFPRLAESGPFRFAGQSWGSAETLEYDGLWTFHQAPCGVSPVIYDNAGALRISDCSIGSQGYRYNDPSKPDPITGDATYSPSPKAPKLYEWTDIGRGDTLVIGQGDSGGVVLWDGTEHRQVAQGICRFVRAHRDGDQVSIAFYRELGGTTTESELVWATVAELKALPVVVPPTPPNPDTFGPIGQPLPDGTPLTMAEYVFGPDFTRLDSTGDLARQMVQVTRPEGRYFIKFNQGSAYELWTTTSNGDIHHLEDASAFDTNTTYHFTHTLWCRATMRTGRAHGVTVPPHEAVYYRRVPKAEINRVGFVREMWLWHAWAQFDCGPDLGVHPVVVLVYDPTGGVHTPPDETDPAKMRGIELYYFALKLGWLRWEYHHSGRVYETDTAQFNDYTRLARGDFYRSGGKVVAPQPTGCATTPTEVPPVPPITPVPPMKTDTLKPGDLLHVDAPLVSQDKRFTFLYQSDGNLVLYGPSGPLWSTSTHGQTVGFCAMQGDGHFVLYDKSVKPRWASGTAGNPGAWLLAQNDGNVVIYSTSGRPLWATGTVYHPQPIPPTPTPGPIEAPVPIRVDGKVFRRPDNTIYQSKSASSFLLLRRLLEEGEAPVREYLAQFYAIGARELRVFSRVNWNGTPGPGLFPDRYPNYWPSFNRLFTIAAEQGIYLEMVALTGPEVGTSWVQQCQAERSKHVNAFLEVSNEPGVNGIDIERIVSELGSTAGWQPWATGQYFPTAMPAGSFCTVHTDRVDGWEWVRKAIKDILEYRDGGGPYEPTDPAMNRPIKGDEPMGAASFHSAGRRDNVPVHHFTAAAGSMLFGSGYCVHHESGLNSIFPSGVELECVTAAFKGMNTVGSDWQLGEYGRVGLAHFPITDDPAVRTYGMRLGNRWKVVRVGPTTPMPVLAPGWRVDKVDAYAGLNVVLELVQG